MEITIKFKVKGKDYTLEYDEARLLYEELRHLYEKPSNFTPFKFDTGEFLNANFI